MTGYGLSSSVEGGSEVSIEIKGVNHRFLEISIKSNDTFTIVQSRDVSLSKYVSINLDVILGLLNKSNEKI